MKPRLLDLFCRVVTRRDLALLIAAALITSLAAWGAIVLTILVLG